MTQEMMSVSYVSPGTPLVLNCNIIMSVTPLRHKWWLFHMCLQVHTPLVLNCNNIMSVTPLQHKWRLFHMCLQVHPWLWIVTSSCLWPLYDSSDDCFICVSRYIYAPGSVGGPLCNLVIFSTFPIHMEATSQLNGGASILFSPVGTIYWLGGGRRGGGVIIVIV
jgi:hypothetical protein